MLATRAEQGAVYIGSNRSHEPAGTFIIRSVAGWRVTARTNLGAGPFRFPASVALTVTRRTGSPRRTSICACTSRARIGSPRLRRALTIASTMRPWRGCAVPARSLPVADGRVRLPCRPRIEGPGNRSTLCRANPPALLEGVEWCPLRSTWKSPADPRLLLPKPDLSSTGVWTLAVSSGAWSLSGRLGPRRHLPRQPRAHQPSRYLHLGPHYHTGPWQATYPPRAATTAMRARSDRRFADFADLLLRRIFTRLRDAEPAFQFFPHHFAFSRPFSLVG